MKKISKASKRALKTTVRLFLIAALCTAVTMIATKGLSLLIGFIFRDEIIGAVSAGVIMILLASFVIFSLEKRDEKKKEVEEEEKEGE
ncbi:hypothetical protein [uncultured Eubacterium sp.]|uniref:hypothetical protein n=1 Tax=uncultured Eubacterium sp. TaxID=165185 RepID=UPI002599B922|nr:hypothetical protein [uncultured Eubacterium sp.]